MKDAASILRRRAAGFARMCAEYRDKEKAERDREFARIYRKEAWAFRLAGMALLDAAAEIACAPWSSEYDSRADAEFEALVDTERARAA
jgi:hypothetical protein